MNSHIILTSHSARTHSTHLLTFLAPLTSSPLHLSSPPRRYDLAIIDLVHTELARRGRSATFIYLLTATFLPEVSALPFHLAALDESYDESTTLSRLFFQASACILLSYLCPDLLPPVASPSPPPRLPLLSLTS